VRVEVELQFPYASPRIWKGRAGAVLLARRPHCLIRGVPRHAVTRNPRDGFLHFRFCQPAADACKSETHHNAFGVDVRDDLIDGLPELWLELT
jgi:hypothetical protein